MKVVFDKEDWASYTVRAPGSGVLIEKDPLQLIWVVRVSGVIRSLHRKTPRNIL